MPHHRPANPPQLQSIPGACAVDSPLSLPGRFPHRPSPWGQENASAWSRRNGARVGSRGGRAFRPGPAGSGRIGGNGSKAPPLAGKEPGPCEPGSDRFTTLAFRKPEARIRAVLTQEGDFGRNGTGMRIDYEGALKPDGVQFMV